MKRLLPMAAVAVVVSLLTALAVLAPGYPVRKLNLNDSGVWVTNNAEALFGRLNKSVESLDGMLGPSGGAETASTFSLDIYQDESHVVARDLRSGRVTAVNAARVAHETDGGISLSPASQLELRGGTIAVLDPATGRLWAGRYSEDDPSVDLGAVDANQKVLAELGAATPGAPEGQGAGLSVGLDGTVHAVSTNGKQVVLRPEGIGFAEPAYRDGAPLASVQVAAIGDGHAVLDARSGKVHLPGGGVRDIGVDPQARIQAAGPASDTVQVATTRALLAVGGGVTTLAEANGNAPAVPVMLAGCTFAAWAGEPGLAARSCGGAPAEFAGGFSDVALVSPVFRTNHGQIVLNDTSDGKIYSFEEQRFVQNWQEAQPLPATDEGDPDQQARPNEDEPPQANDDQIGARPGRTTVAYVLDNDSDALGRILTISKTTKPNGATVEIAPDGQTLLVTLPQEASNVSFEYTIDNGAASDSATVHVEVRPESVNEEPRLRVGAVERTYAVSSWGSMVIPIVGDWRDPDGDPVSVSSVSADSQKVGLTTDGRVTFAATRAEQETLVRVDLRVSDGRGTSVETHITVKVLAYNATDGAAPMPEPDAVRGEVGKPIVIKPLANDIPGADPLNPRATMELAATVLGADGLDVATDLRSGEVTVTASAPGTYFLDYTAKFGSAHFAQGGIRVDAAEVGQSTPTAAPDHVTVRGRAPVMVDVLANDSDPTGAVLTVLSATASDEITEAGQVQAAVLKGRWVRVMPRVDTLSPNPQVVTYTISNGVSAPVRGSVIVTQLPAPTQDQAIVNDDFATVRAGDSVLVPVLENDTSASGEALVLDRNVPDLPAGQLRVIDPNVSEGKEQGDVGTAHVVNDQVRYVAPATVDAKRELRIEYQAAPPEGAPETGVLTVTVNPPPSEESPNSAPQPQNLEARVSAGQTIEIPIQPWRQDADGDTVTVFGLASAPTQGRVLGFSPNAITYQAYPSEGNGGTDVFRYKVTDAYGATETGFVRVAITEPGAVQAPVAVTDTVVAEPDTEIQLHALSNDMFDEVDPPTIVPFEQMGNEVPAGVRLADAAGPILATAPAADAPPLQFAYALQNSGGVGPGAQVVVRSQRGYRNPPRTYDEVAEADGTVATVDVLRRAWDPDGPKSALRVSSVTAADATIDGGNLTIPLTDRTQVVTYVVTDGTGASSASVVFVPAANQGVPYLRDGASIEMGVNSTFSFDVSDYVISPRETPLAITVAESIVASPGQVTVGPDSESRLTLTSSGDYSGPAAVTFEVRDGPADDPATRTALITIPVQVGEATPVLRCPTWTQQLTQGGAPVDLRIGAVCTIWTPDPASAAGLTFTADWAQGLQDVSATPNGQVVTVVAGANAVPEQTGVLRVAVAGFPQTAKDINVQVVAAPRPTLVVSDITDVRQGTAVSQTIQLNSPLREPQPTVISIRQSGGMPAEASADGNRFTITPGADSHGTMTFTVVASDLADPGRTDRHVEATLTVTVYGVPGTPDPPQPSMQLRSKAASVTYTAPPDNGAPILGFRVRGGGKTVECGRATRCDITGLNNGDPVSFQVQAYNRAGDSEWSAPGPSVTPDDVPGRVPSFTVSNPADGQVTLNWSPAINEGSAIQQYLISFGGRTEPASGGQTSLTITGLDNNAVYTFTIVARNGAGVSEEPTSTTGQSSGRPTVSTLNVASSDLGASANVTISWSGVDPQGPRPVTYTVTRTGGSAGTRTWSGVTGTSVGDQVTYDGSTYTYAVTATNATGGAAHTSAPVTRTFQATGRPAAWATPTASATGTSGTLSINYSVPPSRGSDSVVTLYGAGAARRMASGASTTATSFNGVSLSGLSNGQSYTMYLTVCNESGACSQSPSFSATPYGPLSDPSLTVSVSQNTITWSASGSGNGRTATLTVTDPTGSQSVSGAMGISRGPVTRTVGYSQTVTVTATLSDPNGGRGQRVVQRTVTTEAEPPPPRTVTLTRGASIGYYPESCSHGYYGGGPCRYVHITTSGFDGQSYQCTLTSSELGYLTTWRFRGNVNTQPGYYYGHNDTLTANCAGVQGSINW